MPTVATRAKRISTGLAAAAMATVAGCLPPSAPLHACLEVRDTVTGQPIPHATARWTGGNPFIPPREVLGPPISPLANPPGGRTETDASGRARLTLAGSRPNDLLVTADGYRPVHVMLTPGITTIGGAFAWTEGMKPPTSPIQPHQPTMQVRVRPAQ